LFSSLYLSLYLWVLLIRAISRLSAESGRTGCAVATCRFGTGPRGLLTRLCSCFSCFRLPLVSLYVFSHSLHCTRSLAALRVTGRPRGSLTRLCSCFSCVIRCALYLNCSEHSRHWYLFICYLLSIIRYLVISLVYNTIPSLATLGSNNYNSLPITGAILFPTTP
jgi:hypothetical protein